MKKVGNESSNFSLGQVYKIYRDNHVGSNNLTKNLSSLQLSILYAWLYPSNFIELYCDSFEKDGKIRHFPPTDLLMLKPLVSAFMGRPVQDPECLRSYKINRFSAKDVSRFAVAQELATSEIPAVSRKAWRKMKILAKKQKVPVSRMKELAEESFPSMQSQETAPYSPSSPTRDDSDDCCSPPPSDVFACSSDIELEIDPTEMDAILRSSP